MRSRFQSIIAFMNRVLGVIVLAVLILTQAPRTSAQLLNKEAPVIVGHYHLNVTSIEAHKKFWVDTLGGTAMKSGKDDVIRFPNVLLFLHVQKPTGPTYGTALDHIGFAVPDVPAMTTKIVANGYELTTGREPAPGRRPRCQPRATTAGSRTSLAPMARRSSWSRTWSPTPRPSRTTTSTSSTSSTWRCSSGT